jgi:hypothetical protein
VFLRGKRMFLNEFRPVYKYYNQHTKVERTRSFRSSCSSFCSIRDQDAFTLELWKKEGFESFV